MYIVFFLIYIHQQNKKHSLLDGSVLVFNCIINSLQDLIADVSLKRMECYKLSSLYRSLFGFSKHINRRGGPMAHHPLLKIEWLDSLHTTPATRDWISQHVRLPSDLFLYCEFFFQTCDEKCFERLNGK